MKLNKMILGFVLFLVGCGNSTGSSSKSDTTLQSQIDSLTTKVTQLQSVSGSLSALIESDFASCPSSGDTADPLINKMCQVAQAATIEVRVELLNELGIFLNELDARIAAANDDIALLISLIDAQDASISTIQDDIDTINTTLTGLQTQIDDLDVRLTSAEAAIAALQALTASISGTIDGAMLAIMVGEENLAAGPVYEAVLRRSDRTRFNAYTEVYGAYQSLALNALSGTLGSSTVTVNLTSHGYSVGDLVELSGIVAALGFTTGDLLGIFEIQTVPNANSFTLTLARSATLTGVFGGAAGVVRSFGGRGMATAWNSGDASDVAVRTTSAASHRYNYIIRRKASDLTNATAELCYSMTTATASFATINAAPEGGSATIACK